MYLPIIMGPRLAGFEGKAQVTYMYGWGVWGVVIWGGEVDLVPYVESLALFTRF